MAGNSTDKPLTQKESDDAIAAYLARGGKVTQLKAGKAYGGSNRPDAQGAAYRHCMGQIAGLWNDRAQVRRKARSDAQEGKRKADGW